MQLLPCLRRLCRPYCCAQLLSQFLFVFVQELTLQGYSGAGQWPAALLHRFNVLTN